MLQLLVFDQALPLLIPNKVFTCSDADILYSQRKVKWTATCGSSDIRLLPTSHPVINVFEYAPDGWKTPTADTKLLSFVETSTPGGVCGVKSSEACRACLLSPEAARQVGELVSNAFEQSSENDILLFFRRAQRQLLF